MTTHSLVLDIQISGGPSRLEAIAVFDSAADVVCGSPTHFVIDTRGRKEFAVRPSRSAATFRFLLSALENARRRTTVRRAA